MPWRFQKRKRILPGVTLNVSRRGISTSVGPRGAKVNVGRKGIRQTASAPGTGLYATSKPKRFGCLGLLALLVVMIAIAL